MDSAKKLSPRLLVCVAAGALGVAALAGLRAPAPRPAPEMQTRTPLASVDDAPHADVHLASQQAAFAMSHLGALREESDPEARAPERRAAEARPRAGPQRPAAAPRATPPVGMATPAPVATAPPIPPPQAVAQKPSTLFGVPLPSPGQWVDRVAALGDSLTSLVRGR